MEILPLDVTSNGADTQSGETDTPASGVPSVQTASTLAVALLALAFVGAATAGVLASVGPYLLGVSALVLVLFALSRRC